MLAPSPKPNYKIHKIIASTTFKNTTQSRSNNAKTSLFLKTNTLQKPKIGNNKNSNDVGNHKQINSLITTQNLAKQIKKYNTSHIPSSSNKKKQNFSIKNSSNMKTSHPLTQKKKPLASNNPIKGMNFHSTLNSGNLINKNKLLKTKKNNTNKKITKNAGQCPSTTEKNNGKLNENKINQNKQASNYNPSIYELTNQKIKVKQKPIVTTTNSIEKIAHSNSNKQTKQTEYAKIFGLLNNEIKEITDLFKRTQSVDQQKNGEGEQKQRNFTDVNNEDIVIDSGIFEKELGNEANCEKMIDISQLDEIEVKNYNNTESVLFSSYNSEFYKNLVNNNKPEIIKTEEEELIDYDNNSSCSSENNNIIKIAQNNINGICETYKRNDTNNSGKTECQYGDVLFNQDKNENNKPCERNESKTISKTNNWLDDLEKTEKTCNLLEEDGDYQTKSVPIQEIMKQLRKNVDIK